MRKVKIVGTLGPASSSPEMITQLIQAGLDVVRLNFSHGDRKQHQEVFRRVRDISRQLCRPVGVLGDLCGPKIRVGSLRGGSAEIQTGSPFVFTTQEILGDATRVTTSYQPLPQDAKLGTRILVDDGLLEFEVVEKHGSEVVCRTVLGGTLRDHKGMNIPGTPLSTPALTEKDKQDLAFAKELGVDYLALSFVRRAQDVMEAKRLAGSLPIIAKIEKPEAVSALEEIIEVADGLMVARGDLGVEAGAEKVPLIQKRMIKEAAVRGLPVIVATQMLDSMIHNPRPTRAEVSDVANAVLDGADAVMLSGETASGSFPVEAVSTMASIVEEVEKSDIFSHLPEPVRINEHSFSNAIARAAVKAAADLNLKALAIYTETGHSACLASSCRPRASIIAFSQHDPVLQRLALRWGVRPLHGDWVLGVAKVVEQAQRQLLAHSLVQPGDEIGITFGMQDMSGPGRTDVLKLWKIQDETGGVRG